MDVLFSTKFSDKVSYLTQVNENGERPVIETETIYIANPPLHEKDHLKIPMNKTQSEKLYSDIYEAENQLVMTLRNIPNEIFTGLPEDAQKAMFANDMKDCVRCNYSQTENGEFVLFLKGKPNQMVITQNGKPFPIGRLTAGYYKFWIKADTIYCGPHKYPSHVASLMLRISKIEFSNTVATPQRKAPIPPAPYMRPMQPQVLENETPKRGRKSAKVKSMASDTVNTEVPPTPNIPLTGAATFSFVENA